MDEFTVDIVAWSDCKEELMSVRQPVFIDEQKVPADIEIDDREETCIHVLVRDVDGKPVGTGRLDVDGKIGRMAVLKEYRNKGIGGRIIGKLMELGTQKSITSFYAYAQIRAADFYKKHGFKPTGPQFEEAGIQHIKMLKN